MSTAKTLHSVRRLVAFACLLLSLLLVGVGELALEVDYSPIALALVLAGLAATVLSGVWFVVVLFARRPSDDGTHQRGTGNRDEAAASTQDDN